MYTRGGKSTVEKPTLVNKPKIYKGRLGEVREARGGKSTKPLKNLSLTPTMKWIIFVLMVLNSDIRASDMMGSESMISF